MKKLKAVAFLAGVVVCLTARAVVAQTGVSTAPTKTVPPTPADHAMNMRFEDIKWQKIVPELGDKSAEIAILRVDPVTNATQLMIRVPKTTHVPRHWHTAHYREGHFYP